MKNESANLAIVSNNTFEASKSVNLHHYDISSALQTTLEFDKLVNIFSNKIQNLIPHNGFVYENDEFALEIKKGIVTKHSCTYALKVEEMQLGSLKIMRRQRFDDEEIKLLENLLCSLIYPLKNATLFNQALKMAYTDPLTKTNNRAAFNDSLDREIKLANRNSCHLSVIFFDLDHFKQVNDDYGHECGDIALSAAANCIKEALRGSDIVFRYGGEEFVILLSNTNLDAAKAIAERIRQSIENHTIAYGMKILKLTASMGISALRGNDTNESLIQRADNAMYRAKDNGRNQVQIESTALLA
ncbi:MAG: GGDEF domain-containing protein [Methylococcaceae bacterium]|nr:GGDEF domain-containing protein [Methylococcaceae bacterium]